MNAVYQQNLYYQYSSQPTDHHFDSATGTYTPIYGNIIPAFSGTPPPAVNGNIVLPPVYDENTTWNEVYGTTAAPQPMLPEVQPMLPEPREQSVEDFCRWMMEPAEDAFTDQ